MRTRQYTWDSRTCLHISSFVWWNVHECKHPSICLCISQFVTWNVHGCQHRNGDVKVQQWPLFWLWIYISWLVNHTTRRIRERDREPKVKSRSPLIVILHNHGYSDHKWWVYLSLYFRYTNGPGHRWSVAAVSGPQLQLGSKLHSYVSG